MNLFRLTSLLVYVMTGFFVFSGQSVFANDQMFHQVTAENPQTEEKGGKEKNSLPRISFGLHLIIFNSGSVWSIEEPPAPYYPPWLDYSPWLRTLTSNFQVIEKPVSKQFMKGEWSYAIIPRLRILAGLSYFRNEFREKYERHVNYDDPTYSDYEEGEIYEIQMSIVDVVLSARYYLKNFQSGRVSPFLQFGIGKQIARAHFKEQQLFLETPPIEESNVNTFLKKLNSPYHYQFGFGVEYYFNSAISLIAQGIVDYRRVSATYDYRAITANSQMTISHPVKLGRSETYWSMGVNFYF